MAKLNAVAAEDMFEIPSNSARPLEATEKCFQ